LNTTRFVHTSGPYETLKIKGPDLIKNDDLRLKLSEYYDKLVGYQFDLQKSSLESFDKAKERQFELFVNLSLSEGLGMEPLDFEELKQSLYYKSWLNYTYGERRWEVRNFEVLKEKNEQLVDLIELEIIKS